MDEPVFFALVMTAMVIWSITLPAIIVIIGCCSNKKNSSARSSTSTGIRGTSPRHREMRAETQRRSARARYKASHRYHRYRTNARGMQWSVTQPYQYFRSRNDCQQDRNLSPQVLPSLTSTRIQENPTRRTLQIITQPSAPPPEDEQLREVSVHSETPPSYNSLNNTSAPNQNTGLYQQTEIIIRPLAISQQWGNNHDRHLDPPPSYEQCQLRTTLLRVNPAGANKYTDTTVSSASSNIGVLV